MSYEIKIYLVFIIKLNYHDTILLKDYKSNTRVKCVQSNKIIVTL